jgi:hypothetical protein
MGNVGWYKTKFTARLILMRRLVRTLTILLLIIASNFASVAFSQAAELSLQLVESRIGTLRESGAESTKETLKIYESVRSWLDLATTHEQNATNYLAALKSAPSREVEILARMNALGPQEQTIIDIEGFHAKHWKRN